MLTPPENRSIPSKQRVVLGMSGGVDSSVAAALLLREGYEVVGVTMKVWPQDCLSRAEDKCCGPQAVADARGVAHALGIPHYVVDESEDFSRYVIDYFASEYRSGRTPNPCVVCNEKLKFGRMAEKAAKYGASLVATGHYARIAQQDGHLELHRAADSRKDQSYFLFSLGQEQLEKILFPLGHLTKLEIRAIAKELGLKVHNKEDSQEICFVPGNDYTAFLKSHLGEDSFHKGGIYDTAGHYLGEHEGIELYTVGQRKGLPGGSKEPRYVVRIEPEHKRVIVGAASELLTSRFRISRCSWSPAFSGRSAEATVKIRYNHTGCLAVITRDSDGTASVSLPVPQRAVTPGQAAVFYQGDLVLGGGWIESLSPDCTLP